MILTKKTMETQMLNQSHHLLPSSGNSILIHTSGLSSWLIQLSAVFLGLKTRRGADVIGAHPNCLIEVHLKMSRL